MQRAIEFFGMVLDAESALAEQPAEAEPTPCGA